MESTLPSTERRTNNDELRTPSLRCTLEEVRQATSKATARTRRRLFLIDTYGFIFRAYHARARSAAPPMRTSTGLSTEAIYIFHNMLRKLRTEYEPEYIASVFESGRTFREDSFAAYKANRAEMPDDLREGEGLKGVQTYVPPRWQDVWKAGQWNHLRARIEGDVPHIQVWLNGTRITDWRDTANHLSDGATDGMIALQVHGGNRWIPGSKHRFRNVSVQELR